jgi:OmpA-OmpF porin, OOP family
VFRRPSSRAAALAAAVSLQALLLADPTSAQSVQMFDQAPSIEDLRKILIPETGPGGLSRRIELPRREALAGAPTVRPASMTTSETGSAPAASPTPAPTAAPAATTTETPAPASAEPSTAAPRPIAAVRPAPRRPDSGVPAASRPSEAPVSATTARLDTEAPAPTAAPVDAVGFRINFALNSAVIPTAYEAYIDRIGELMRQEPGLALQIEGHTDATGPDQYNLELSERRAIAVARYLVVRHGVDPERLQVAGKGKGQPLLENPYDARNRRVQFMRAE